MFAYGVCEVTRTVLRKVMVVIFSLQHKVNGHSNTQYTNTHTVSDFTHIVKREMTVLHLVSKGVGMRRERWLGKRPSLQRQLGSRDTLDK